MARKRLIFFPRIQSFLVFVLFVFSLGLTFVVDHVLAQTPNVQSPSPVQLIKEGRTLYEGERFAEAAEIWKQAIAIFATQSDELNQAMALSNLSLSYQEMGKLLEAENAIKESLKLLETQPRTKEQLRILAQTLDIIGQLHFLKGQSEKAIENWQKSLKIYEEIDQKLGVIQSQVNQAQAMQALGLYNRSLAMLNEVRKKLEEPFFQTQDRTALQIGVSALRIFGNALRVVGNLEESKEILQQSLKIAEESNFFQETIVTQLSLAETERAISNKNRNLLDDQTVGKIIKYKDYERAVFNLYKPVFTRYLQVANSESQLTTKIFAQLNHLSLLLDIKKWWTEQLNKRQIAWPELELQLTQEALDLWDKIKSQLKDLPPNSSAIYAQINLAQSLVCLAPQTLTNREIENSSPIMQQCASSKENVENSANPSWQEIAQILANAVQQAHTLKDERAEAYALGYLGGVYQQIQDYLNAEKLTSQALSLTRLINAPDIAYRWQWQLGRLRKAQGNTESAIKAYTAAFDILKSLRRNLVAISRDVQFNFRDSVEPVYRELVELLLKEQPTSEELKLARDAIEALQLAELDDYFRSACTSARPEQIDRVIDESYSTTAVLYSIILKEKLAVILKLPGKELRYYSNKVSSKSVNSTLEKLLEELKEPRFSITGMELSKQVYDLLIKPVEKDLAENGMKTLVFVLDGALRNIPMAALYDGKEYVLNKEYAVALTLGLQLLSPKALARESLKVLGAGVSLSQEIEGKTFPKIEEVKIELERVKEKVSSKILLDKDFTKTKFQEQIDSANFSAVHIATHGQFSSNIEQTYLVAWDELLKVTDLDVIFRNSDRIDAKTIELLVLTACETAKGDSRATLGIAGVAVRAGARSTIASLWRADDQLSSLLTDEFYKQLKANPNISKSEALRQAQRQLIENQPAIPPYKWAPYILIGNWQ